MTIARRNWIVRADGGQTIGAGHIMRSLALADALRDLGCRVEFVTHADDSLVGRIRARGFETSAPSEASLDEDARALAAQASAAGASIIVDGYAFTEPFHRALKAANSFVVCIDDQPAMHYVADVIVNHNVYAPGLNYACDAATRLLLGPQYALLTAAFRDGAPREIPAAASRVIVTMGGADPDNVTSRALASVVRAAAAGQPLETRVIVGGSNPHRETIGREAGNAPIPVDVIVDAGDMAQQFQWADLAVSAAGGTSLEMLAVGLPSVKVALSWNQEPIGTALELAGVCRYLGKASDVGEADLAHAIAALASSADRRAAMCAKGRQMVDGRGAERVAREIAA